MAETIAFEKPLPGSKNSSGKNFTIHFPVNGPSGYMKKFSGNFFDAAGARRVKYRTYFIKPSPTKLKI